MSLFKKKKIKILNYINDNANNGVGYHRQYLPLETIRKQGLMDVRTYGFNEGQKHLPEMTNEELQKEFTWADIVYCSRNDHPVYISRMLGTAKYCGVPLVVDYDDLVQSVPPCNPGFRSFAPNSPAKTFNLNMAYESAGIIVSTKNLYRFYKQFNKNIFVCENAIDFKWRDTYLNIPPKIKKEENEIRIGWAGSSSHYENLKYIEPVVMNILEKYPNTTFYFTGMFGGLFDKKEYKDRVHIIPFYDHADWPRGLKEMGLDIALAPLTDCLFNRAKSNLRCLEYSACKYAIVASRVEPYNYIKNNKTGLLAVEQIDWQNCIEKLINNPKLRIKLGENAYNQAKKYYNMEDNCQRWVDAFGTILRKFRNKI